MKKIVSVQALRALAFLGIFLMHAGASTFKWPALGVSIFFVLSGYLLILQNSENCADCSVKSNIRFSWNKIKKIYPLHILTMCCAILLFLARVIYKGITIKNIVYLAGVTGLNATLLQAWVPNINVNTSLNGVAWYLSVAMFLYFMFPYIARWIKDKDKKLLRCICVGILIAEIVLCVPFIWLLGNDSPVYIWFMYCFPVFRLGDFFIGCCLGKESIENKTGKECSNLKFSIYEILATVVTIMVFWYAKQEVNNVFLVATHNWTTIYIPLSVMWVVLFVKNGGVITKALTNRITIFLGNISAYMFLIHYVITRYTSAIVDLYNLKLSFGENIIKILIELLLTIAVTLLYMKISHKKIEF